MTDEIEIQDVGVLSGNVLQDELSASGVSFEIKEQDHGAHGELGTLTVIAVLGAPLVLGLAGWLLKTRNDKTIVANIRRRYPDGTVEDINFKHVIQNESEPKPELIEALTNAIKLPAA